MTNTNPTADAQVFATTHTHLRAAFGHLEEAIKALSGASDAGLGDELSSTTDDALLELGDHRGSVAALVLWTQRMAEGLAKRAGVPVEEVRGLATPPTREQLGLLLGWRMASDPPPVPKEDDDAIGELLEGWSRELGFDSWVAAYHSFPPRRTAPASVSETWGVIGEDGSVAPAVLVSREKAAEFVNGLAEGGGTNVSN